MKKIGLKGIVKVYTDTNDILDIHKYLIKKKNNIKQCLG